MEQAFPAFVAAVGYLILLNAEKFKKSIAFNLLAIGLAVLTLTQIISSSSWSNTENQRYEEERQAAVNIANDIRNDFDINKPVVFIGDFRFSDSLEEKITMEKGSVEWKIYDYVATKDINIVRVKNYKICDTLCRSYLSWGVSAFNEHGTENYKFFDYINCHLEPCTDEQYNDAVKNHCDIPAYPLSGYIFDAGDYLIVNLG